MGAALLSLLVENSPIPNSNAPKRNGTATGRRANGKGNGGPAPATVPAFAYTYRRLEGSSLKNQTFVEATPAMVRGWERLQALEGREGSLFQVLHRGADEHLSCQLTARWAFVPQY